MPETRRRQMNSALKLTGLFILLYGLVTQQVLANGLDLLGLQAPEKM